MSPMNKMNLKVISIAVSIVILLTFACSKKSPTESETIQDKIHNASEISESVSNKYEVFIASNPESQARRLLVNELESYSAVQNAGISADSTTVWWKLKNGLNCAFLTETILSLAKNQSNAVELPKFKKQHLEKKLLVNKNALMLSPFQWQMTSSDATTSIKNLFHDADFHVEYLSNEDDDEANFSLADYKDFDDYGAVYILTHGHLDGDNNIMLNAGIEINKISDNDMDEFAEGLNEDYFDYTTIKGIEGKRYLAFSPKWIKSLYSQSLQSTLIYANACVSLFNSTMANAMIGTSDPTSIYFGWTNKPTKNDGNETAQYFFNELLNAGLDCGDAWENLRDNNLGISRPFKNPVSYLEYKGNSELQLINVVE